MKIMQIEVSLQGEPVWIVAMTYEDDSMEIQGVFEDQFEARKFRNELKAKGYTTLLEMWTIK